MGIQKYRIAWKFTGKKNANGQFSSASSPSFWRSNTTKGYVDLSFKTLPSGNAACCFYLRFSNPIYHTQTDQYSCSYYLLNDATGKHQKLVNFSPFMSEWFDLGVSKDHVEFMVVLVLNYDDPVRPDFLHWWETKTETLKSTVINYLQSVSQTLINGKPCLLKIIGETQEGKEIFMDGLKDNEFVSAKFEILNNESAESDRDLEMVLRSSATTSLRINAKERIGSVEILSISYRLSDMKKVQIARISKIIENIDLLTRNDSAELCKLMEDFQLQQLPEKNPKIEVASTCNRNKPRIIEVPMLTTHSAADILPKLPKNDLFKCFAEQKFCDISIEVGCIRVQAHKCVLFGGSTVWRQLLTENGQLSIISVADMDIDTFQTLLTFIYIGSVPKPPKQTDQLLIVADTYGVDGLKTWCEEKLISTITIESAINLLVLAHRYKAKTLFDEVWTFARKNAAELRQQPELKSFFVSCPELAFDLFKNLLDF